MSSVTAKKAAGTFIHDSIAALPGLQAWITRECRTGALAPAVKRFCEAQPELLEPTLVLVENLAKDSLLCRIPCKVSDCESPSTFDFEVTFQLDPQTGTCRRL